jgi:hypothetical protein
VLQGNPDYSRIEVIHLYLERVALIFVVSLLKVNLGTFVFHSLFVYFICDVTEHVSTKFGVVDDVCSLFVMQERARV